MRSGTPRRAAEVKAKAEGEVRAAVHALAAGRMVVVADDREREDEGDLVAAAALMSTEQMAFFLRHGSGIVCAPMPDERADELELPLMVDQNTESHGTAFTVSVDHRGVGTGISAADRAATIRALAGPGTRATDLRRPGHVFPLRARPGGVLKRTGHTEAATDLVRLAGMAGVGVSVYLRGHEGRGIGLGHKLRAYALQERGHDTVDANTALGLPVDSRDYGIGAAILAGLGVRRLRLITNNPHKYGGLSGYDLDLVGRVRTPAAVTTHNIAYLRTKRDRMGHDLDLPAQFAQAT
jgi:3,4-dihydroxy-2-butanone 4-phosphate synthase